jgi:CRISPR/Cas system-associated endoribonuclease Cas2
MCVSQSHAQQSGVTIDMEPEIENVLELHKAAWIKVKRIDGYRIQIVAFAGSNASEKATKMKEEVEKIFKEMPCYISYYEPNFRIRLGDFRSRMDAQRMLNTVKLQYPGAFIVADKVFFKI